MIRRSPSQAFSLIEIAFSLAIIATVVIALLGILPAGVDTSRRAGESTTVATIFSSLNHRLQGEPLAPGRDGSVSFSPALFDAQGQYIPADAPAEDVRRAIFRAEIKLADWQERPANASSLRVVKITLKWPVSSGLDDPTIGGSRGHQATVSYPVTTLTGTDWPEIARAYTPSPVFTPKIGF